MIAALRPDDSRAFLVGDLKPAAQLDRGRDVLLLRSAPARPPRPLPADAAAADEAGRTRSSPPVQGGAPRDAAATTPATPPATEPRR